RDNIKGKANANETHHEVGKKIRQTIKELGGEMPENLSSPEKSVKSIEKEQAKSEKK
ncbi:MAG: DNA damage-inducible protein D, partial [Candidatus Magasanikbacteria bacterium]|nr:DNA damage-inducible protein D [Candidatus Magasanikbacteria bacterium]